MPHNLAAYILPALLLVAAINDVRTYRIPNWLTLSTAALFFPVALWLGLPPGEYLSHVMAGALLFCIGFVVFQFGLFGGGDAKLIAAAGLWFGMGNLAAFLFWMAIAGGAMALAIVGWGAVMFASELRNGNDGEKGIWKKIRSMKPDLPYAVAIAAGGMVAFFHTGWLHGLGQMPQ